MCRRGPVKTDRGAKSGKRVWSRSRREPPSCDPLIWVGTIAICLGLSASAYGQTASTGALTGTILDSSGGVLPDVVVTLFNPTTTEKQSAISDREGLFTFLSLLPGRYELRTSKANFEPMRIEEVKIHVTETLRIEVHLQLAKRLERVEVSSDPFMAQTDTSALGRLVNDSAVGGLRRFRHTH